ncbi:MAG: hypothetical protein COU68_01770 [Candidatus Pacebacteria bacterium CG10_big_fil_rev_8_21_14_0_10_45_6]|nr:MAG: hypothetical protein COU68_01770 [Candidatus Pacebacteria bacterium CG10_big_fil_rev_8_21_14_0_10_45_6]
MKNSTNTFFTVVAVVLSVIALALAWSAYNRSGVDLEQQLGEQYQTFEERAVYQMQVLEAKAKIATLRARIVAGATYEEVEEDMAELNVEIEQAYVNAKFETQQKWTEMNQELQDLETALRDNTADAINALDRVLERFETDVRYDEASE